MEKVKEIWKKYEKFLIAPFGVTLILLLLYAIKGIYPFGEMTIANGDMGQSYMTFYHFLYDMIYHGKSVFYDYTLGMGSNMYGGFIIDGLLNPLTWVILLSGRENIAHMFSFILILKVAFIALTSFILFNRLFKENKYYNIIFSMLYALSGYVLMYNTNIMWLDVVGLFPLFILAIKHMFETNKIYWYSICLSLMLIFNYNLAYMVLMFIIFVLPIYVKLGLSKEKRKKAIYNIIIGTILSVGLSAFAFIPAFMQTMTSYRMSGATTNTVENINILFKMVVFLFYAIPLYGFMNWLKYYKQDKTNIRIAVISLIFTAIIPIIFERVNLLWHTGSYQSFPYRYGFIPILILYLGALQYFNCYQKTEKTDIKFGKVLTCFAIGFFAITLLIQIENVKSINHSQPALELYFNNFMRILIPTVIMLFVIKVVHNIENQTVRKILLTGIVTVEMLVYSYAYVGVNPAYRGGREWSDEPIFTSYEIASTFALQDTQYRIKDLTALTSENCPLVYNVPSMSTFLHLISKEQVINAEQMGYSHNRTKLNDFGGTAFSDAIYGIKYVLTKQDLPEDMYQYIASTQSGIRLYEYKNTLPIGIPYQNEVTDIPENLGVFGTQNYVYKNLFNKQEELIKPIDSNTVKTQEKGMHCQYTLEIKEKSILYMDIKDAYANHITINGKPLSIPALGIEGNTIYPIENHNGILDLGIYENQTVEIQMDILHEKDKHSDVQFGILNLEKYYEIFNQDFSEIKIEVKGNQIIVNGEVDKDTNLFIPINYDKGWKVLNNNTANIKRVYHNFIGIELKQGQNHITLEFRPYLYNESMLITIATIIGMIIFYFIGKKWDIRNVTWLMNIFGMLGIVIYIGCLWKVYISSIINTFIS